MRASTFLALLLAPALTWGALCDDTYYLNQVTQSTYAGGDPANLAQVNRKAVRPDLSDLDYLDSNMAYAVLSKFEGSCTKTTKPLTFRSKGAGEKVFKDSLDMTYSVQMYDTNTQVEGFLYDYWFGFFKPAATLRFPLGRFNAKSDMFESWYVGVTFLDSVRNPTSGLWTVTSKFYSLAGPDDSLSLENRMVDATIGAIPLDENRKGRFQVQYLKVSYDSRQPNTGGISAGPKASSGFQVTRTGSLVLIRPGVQGQAAGEPLSLYGMMGNKVATLHPTGFAYQWDGRTSAGAEASTGVYFVQAGNRILGKFFYSR